MKHIAVIGGGAAGLMAALSAAEQGAHVALFERNDRVGKKLSMTGNGQGNFTNTDIAVHNYHCPQDLFVATVLDRFTLSMTLEFFDRLGIPARPDSRNRYYPRGLQASGLTDAFRLTLERYPITLQTQRLITGIKPGLNEWLVNGPDHRAMAFDSVILACGGKAAPHTGSDGSGYDLIRPLGHTVTPLYPALVPLKLNSDWHKAMANMKWEAGVQLLIDKKPVDSLVDDIIFTDYGISGSAIFQLSRAAVRAHYQKKHVIISLDLLPEENSAQTLQHLKIRRNRWSHCPLDLFFSGWINKRIGQTLLRIIGKNLSHASQSLTESDLFQLSHLLHDLRFDVSGHLNWPQAQITLGGVDCAEIDPQTLQSRLHQGLRFAGEIMDVDGACGGYNLQWAWSSGWVAGSSSATEKSP